MKADYLSTTVNFSEIIFLGLRTIIVIMNSYRSYLLIYILELLLFCIVVAYLIILYFLTMPFNDNSISNIWGILLISLGWTIICCGFSHIVTIFQGQLILWITILVLVIFLSLGLRNYRVRQILLTPISKILSESEGLIQCQQIYNCIMQTNDESQMIISGLASTHKTVCETRDCILEDIEEMYDPKLKKFVESKSEVIKDFTYRKYIMKTYFEELLSKNKESCQIHIFYS